MRMQNSTKTVPVTKAVVNPFSNDLGVQYVLWRVRQDKERWRDEDLYAANTISPTMKTKIHVTATKKSKVNNWIKTKKLKEMRVSGVVYSVVIGTQL